MSLSGGIGGGCEARAVLLGDDHRAAFKTGIGSRELLGGHKLHIDRHGSCSIVIVHAAHRQHRGEQEGSQKAYRLIHCHLF